MKLPSARLWKLPACTLLAVGAVAVAVPSASAKIDPSAFGVSASGPLALAPTPQVDYATGGGLSAYSVGTAAGALHAGAGFAAAGNGYATAWQEHVRYGGIEIDTVTAECRDGRTSVQIRGTAFGRALTPSRTAQSADGLSVSVGTVTHYSDGSNAVAGATITGPGGEEVQVAVARCGATS